MCAAAYQRSEPASGCIRGPGASSMKSEGCDGACVAKKKSGPWPAQAVPSLRSFVSKVLVTASRRPGLLDLARSINCGADIFSAAMAGIARQSNRRASFHMAEILYRARTLAGTVSGKAGGNRYWCSLNNPRRIVIPKRGIVARGMTRRVFLRKLRHDRAIQQQAYPLPEMLS